MTCQGPYRCPGCPACTTRRRPLTAADESRIQRALRNDPSIYGSRPLRLVQTNQEQTSYSAPQACDGSMTCDCPRCQQQRAVLINAGPKLVRQPWETKRAA